MHWFIKNSEETVQQQKVKMHVKIKKYVQNNELKNWKERDIQ